MKKGDLYVSILRKLSSQKEQNMANLSFLNEIIYYATRISDANAFINKAVDVISRYIGHSAIYLIDSSSLSIFLKYSTIKNMPERIELEDYSKFIDTLIKKSVAELNVKQMELSESVERRVSFDKRFSMLPLALTNVKLPLGMMVIDTDLEDIETSRLQTLNTAVVLISNSISYAALINEHRVTLKNILKLILKIIRFGDLSTYRHSLRVKRYAMEMGKMLSLSLDDMKRLHLSSLLHDIGKIAIPYEILHKEETLSREEFEIIKQHTRIGYNLLKDFSFAEAPMRDILNHHEKLDGSGYPNGITKIERVTQILAVADIIDAIAATRSYKEDKGFSYITEELENLKGKYDDEIVKTAVDFVNSNRFLVLKKRMKTIEKREKDMRELSVGNLQEKINQLKSENQSLSKQAEMYKNLLNKSQKIIEEVTQKTQETKNEISEKYKNIIELLFNSIDPLSIVFVKIQDATLSITRVKGDPINLENSIRLLSNKKVFKAVSSNSTYISRRLIAFPLFNEEAVCVVLSNESNPDAKTLENVRQSLENIVKS